MRLPRTALPISSVIGKQATLLLAAQLPRCRAGSAGHKSNRPLLYVPKKLPIGHIHRIERIIGRDSAVKLVAEFGGEIVHLPLCADYFRDVRDREILRLHRNGINSSKIADLVGITRSRVSQILRTCGLEPQIHEHP